MRYTQHSALRVQQPSRRRFAVNPIGAVLFLSWVVINSFGTAVLAAPPRHLWCVTW